MTARYTFDDMTDIGGGKLVIRDAEGSGPDLTAYGDVTNESKDIYGGAVRLGGNNGYLELPPGSLEGMDEITLEIWMKAHPRNYWERGFDFGRVENGRTKAYIFFAPAAKRVALSKIGHFSEEIIVDMDKDTPMANGWVHFVFEMRDGAVFVYANGRLRASLLDENIKMADYRGLNRLYFGKSQYEHDPYLHAVLGRITIHDRILSGREIHKGYYAKLEEIAENEIRTLELPNTLRVTENIELPERMPETRAKIFWSSDNKNAVLDNGVVCRPPVGAEDARAVLTAYLTGVKNEKNFDVSVAAQFTELERVRYDTEHLSLGDDLSALTHSLELPETGPEGSSISWRAEGAINSYGVISRPGVEQSAAKAALTATVKCGDAVMEKHFDITVAPEETAAGYLFVYFTGNNMDQERLHYALTRDGRFFTPLNGGKYVLRQTKGTLCLRDPFVIHGADGYYYLIATDMQSTKGWSSNRGLITWRSSDLIHWTDETVIEIADKFHTTMGADRIWAPQAIYDEERGEYMIYFAVRVHRPNSYTKAEKISPHETHMWYAYTKDFKTLTSEPRLLFRPRRGQGIDGDIYFKNGTYYMFYKDESNATIKLTTAQRPDGPYGDEADIDAYPGLGLEGVCVYKDLSADRWYMMADAYGAGHYVMAESTDLRSFKPVDKEAYAFEGFHPRHGHVVPVSERQMDALMKGFGGAI
ncbi:MAG: family 43 glycosylhydrolase [Oscillospiraceae bacterium]|nr:family 43 glycosylhydrolase [Oscillospiraceae bacterium]